MSNLFNKKIRIGKLLYLMVLMAAPVAVYAAFTPFTSTEVPASAKLNAVLPPIGSIIAWNKSMPGVPTALPAGWVECNGQTISDTESPMNTETVPNLNNHADYTKISQFNNTGAFLRGGTTSGVVQTDAFQGHYPDLRAYGRVHDSSTYNGGLAQGYVNGGGNENIIIPSSDRAVTNASYKGDGENGTPRVSTETRPVNMSVVWIMRIK